MRGALKLVWDLVIVVHRWIGVATCLLFVMWFVSGLVMVYVPYPALTPAERVAGEDPIDWSKVKVGPDQALTAADVGAGAGGLTLSMMDGAPVWRVGGPGGITVAASDGRVIDGVDSAVALRIARAFDHWRGGARVDKIDHDQWTVSGDYQADQPLYRVALADPAGTTLYVSSVTGQVVLDTNRTERFWNWIGAVPHWLYFEGLRQNGRLWVKVILWTSGLGIVGAATGLANGLIRLRPRRGLSPYRGWMQWHHLGGLVSGLFVLTWIVSGWLSMNPNNWFAASSPDEAALASYAGGENASLPFDAARLARPDVREARETFAAGRPIAVLVDGEARRAVLGPATGAPVRPDPQALFARAGLLAPGAKIISRQVLTAEDVYWYGTRTPARLPTLRVVFDDPKRTWFHIDAATGEVAGQLTAEDRAGRWAFNFLHDLDLPLLLRTRPSWDVLLWLLLGGGLVVSLSAVVVGWRRLRLKAASLTSGLRGPRLQ